VVGELAACDCDGIEREVHAMVVPRGSPYACHVLGHIITHICLPDQLLACELQLLVVMVVEVGGGKEDQGIGERWKRGGYRGRITYMLPSIYPESCRLSLFFSFFVFVVE
jgi:hypothetical protein